MQTVARAGVVEALRPALAQLHQLLDVARGHRGRRNNSAGVTPTPPTGARSLIGSSPSLAKLCTKVAMTVALTSSVQPSGGAPTTATCRFAGRAASVLDDHGLLQRRFQPLRHHARGNVGRAAGRVGADDRTCEQASSCAAAPAALNSRTARAAGLFASHPPECSVLAGHPRNGVSPNRCAWCTRGQSQSSTSNFSVVPGPLSDGRTTVVDRWQDSPDSEWDAAPPQRQKPHLGRWHTRGQNDEDRICRIIRRSVGRAGTSATFYSMRNGCG